MTIDPQEAEIKRLQLLAGLVSVAEVVAWADELIEKSDLPETWMMDLSMSSHAHVEDVIAQLDTLSAGCDHLAAIRIILGQMYRILLHDRGPARQFAKVLFQLAVDHFFDLPPDLGFCCGTDDSFDLAEHGYWIEDQVTDDFIKHLEPFSKLSVTDSVTSPLT
jgi:hypothetical protein